MTADRQRSTKLSSQLLVAAYQQGFFPMADEDGTIGFHHPEQRAIIPIEDARPNRSTRRAIASGSFSCTIDHAFRMVMEHCAKREETWISHEMIGAYSELHEQGIAHSVETWDGDELVGGIYGLAMGGVFFGESMFNSKSNGGKVAFYHLIAHLRHQKFMLFDSQIINPFTARLGAVEVKRDGFMDLLRAALAAPVQFHKE